jgi:hypothetical protein
MTEHFQFEQRSEFPDAVGDKKVIASSVGPNGEAVLLAVERKFEKDPFSREERKGFAIFPYSRAKQSYPATLLRLDGHQVIQSVELEDVEIAFPSVQPLTNGEIVLVGARSHFLKSGPEKNAVVYSGDGKVLRRFTLGDGINDVQTTGDGVIWVSYFDEGVFGNFGWNDPMGSSGLICFDSHGNIVWQFTPPAGFDSICDCYSLNVAKNGVWSCYYTEFPVVRIDSSKKVRGWTNEVGGASALAVDGQRVLLWGGYGDTRTRCVMQNLSGEALNNPREVQLALPVGFDLMTATVVGRDSTLHAFTENAWFTFDMMQIA